MSEAIDRENDCIVSTLQSIASQVDQRLTVDVHSRFVFLEPHPCSVAFDLAYGELSETSGWHTDAPDWRPGTFREACEAAKAQLPL